MLFLVGRLQQIDTRNSMSWFLLAGQRSYFFDNMAKPYWILCATEGLALV